MSEPTFINMPESTPEVPKKKRNTGLMIGIGIAVFLCCCCLVLGIALWFSGDMLVEAVNSAGSFAP